LLPSRSRTQEVPGKTCVEAAAGGKNRDGAIARRRSCETDQNRERRFYPDPLSKDVFIAREGKMRAKTKPAPPYDFNWDDIAERRA
jgi:hypothetical protein